MLAKQVSLGMLRHVVVTYVFTYSGPGLGVAERSTPTLNNTLFRSTIRDQVPARIITSQLQSRHPNRLVSFELYHTMSVSTTGPELLHHANAAHTTTAALRGSGAGAIAVGHRHFATASIKF